MVATSLALFAILAQRPKDQYTLGVVGDGFVVRRNDKRETIPLAPPEAKPKTYLSFRRDKRWAVWDERGLTTRDGAWSSTDRLESVPTSLKAQEKAAILEALAAVKAGKRSLAADGLSGARRIGGTVYLLVRWDGADGEPWLEALLSVDLSKPHPKARLLGRFAGLSLGRGAIDDRLAIEKGRLAVAVNAPDAWGFATYDPAKGVFGFSEQGSRLVALDGDKIVEETPYGTLVAGRRQNGHTIPWLELRAKTASFVTGEGPVLVRAGSRLRNAATGAEVRLPRNAALRRSSSGLLVFWPEAKPRSARLLDFDRLEERARWEKGTRREDGGTGKRSPLKSR